MNIKVERTWFDVASVDHETAHQGLWNLGGLNKKDGATALQAAIIRMAEGGDVSPHMREVIAGALRVGEVSIVPCKSPAVDRYRDRVIAMLAYENLVEDLSNKPGKSKFEPALPTRHGRLAWVVTPPPATDPR